MLFEFVNKVRLPRSDKGTTMSGPDLYLMEILSKYPKVNLLAIVMEHINIVVVEKEGKHGLAYGFWLKRVFSYFNVKCSKDKDGSSKQIFNIMTLEDNDCIPNPILSCYLVVESCLVSSLSPSRFSFCTLTKNNKYS